MVRFMQGSFNPKNPKKYIGSMPIIYRSSWELTIMNWCDASPAVLQWASESLRIPYMNPLTGRFAIYIPDFLIFYQDKNGAIHGDLIEVKPLNQTVQELAKSRNDKLAYIQNQAKWKAATAYCKKNNLTFRVMTQADIYRNANK